jgi:hypothetical protein
VSAIAALTTVYLAIRERTRERRTKRPSFVPDRPKIWSQGQNGECGIRLSFRNQGEHAAAEIVGRVVFAECGLTKRPTLSYSFNLPSLDVNAGDAFEENNQRMEHNLADHYIHLKWEFEDAVTGEHFTQQTAWKWRGLRGWQPSEDFRGIPTEEMKKLSAFLAGSEKQKC